MLSRHSSSALRRCRPTLCAAFSSSTDSSKRQDVPVAKVPAPGTKKPAPAASKRASPAQNLRDVLEALDTMIEEAERKVEKKYRPNMFAEFKQLNDTEGKVLEGPEKLIEVGKAKLVPTLPLEDLNGKPGDLQSLVSNGKVTLMLTSFKNFGLEMLPGWREGFLAAFADQNGRLDAEVQMLGLNMIEDWYMKLVSGSIVKGLKEKTPGELHSTTYAHFGRRDPFRTTMDLGNSFVGYAHLIDGKGRVRWIAGGRSTPEELKRLEKVTKELLAQNSQSQRRR
ncbi:hypothetical protein BBO99_00000297 [Phytophthora kernoviae]|uniref:Uncharacterized protein n=1 Tax=Phytophthora kernoviae TaxID=325452 RepID=A0A3R7G0G6_9STRA|nr:hypothetical protein JM16_000055 [Phytophthora kernoviae]RLN11126.1 hypothetical protein BBI17_000164 [Phytophthora kernoviae]RLN86035.1 hypothetical protein BBO99_00000297 [Phytophthora kernoviae]